MKEYNEGDIILCTVTDIVKTTVFVETFDGIKGSIVFSEVAPGRIRNIRDYAVPKKVIVCKILKAAPDHLFLSLRRVKDKEKKEMMDLYKKEKTYESVIKKITGEKSSEIIKKIKSNQPLAAFFELAKNDSSLLREYFEASEAAQLVKILSEKKEKERDIKIEFMLSCSEPDGINRIKSIAKNNSNIYYLGSSKFVIKEKTFNPKQAASKLNQVMEEIEKGAKKNKCEFKIMKK